MDYVHSGNCYWKENGVVVAPSYEKWKGVSNRNTLDLFSGLKRNKIETTGIYNNATDTSIGLIITKYKALTKTLIIGVNCCGEIVNHFLANTKPPFVKNKPSSQN